MYNRSKWYWIVGGSTTQVYSSASSTYVPLSDSGYVTWLEAGNFPTKITADDMLLIQINILEESATQRRIREAAIGSDGGWLSALNVAIAALRAQL